MPDSLKKHIKDRSAKKNLDVVWVSCEGENPADIENIGTEVKYHSMGGEQGFLGRYFPYRQSPGYLQPIVAVRFESIQSKLSILYLILEFTHQFLHCSRRFDQHWVQGMGQEH